MASYRYRAEIPAKTLAATLNDPTADVLIFAKPMHGDEMTAWVAKKKGQTIIADFCDPHWDNPVYQWFLKEAHYIVCSTPELAKQIKRESFIVTDTYERDERSPHCNGMNLLWFGHAINGESLRSMDHGYEMRIVSNIPGSIPWSQETVTNELARADMVLLPKTADYKSPNRALEAIRSGCFVVAEPHPSLLGFPIWQGNIKEGIEWAYSHQNEANQMIREAQGYIEAKYSPQIQADAWRTVLKGLGLTSDQGKSNGLRHGSMSI